MHQDQIERFAMKLLDEGNHPAEYRYTDKGHFVVEVFDKDGNIIKDFWLFSGGYCTSADLFDKISEWLQYNDY